MKKEVILIINVLGLYVTFLTWSILQERINTKPYQDQYFKSPLIINLIQAFFASIVGYIYSIIKKSNPFDIFKTHTTKLFGWLLLISLTSSLSSPIGYKSLTHLDYLAYLLAKSCKLIPVMFVHFIFYKTKFPLYKYIVACLVTFGVIIFTFAHKQEKTRINDGNTPLGLVYLIGSMLLDGLTNSTQDQLFKLPVNLTGAKLMCILNLFVFILTLGYTIIFTNELTYGYNFILNHNEVIYDILLFSGCGAIGQVFIFVILEKFDSIILITATVTRKMLSMVLSVLLFGHYLNINQIIGIILVFGGISYEALIKLTKKKKHID
ncbi:unnamed protein product [Candida verbasci]|uniref:UDP-galactose transporter homolog 1 n=1 Tax=Candida verbasci TaxID=1227364 RepID=A0A9W4XAA7_9ASCO|nr:unnamed protein product [Candida verbasci]